MNTDTGLVCIADDGSLCPAQLSIISHDDMVAALKEQRPEGLNMHGKLRKEVFIDLVVTIMTSRVQTGVDMKFAKKWEDRCSLLENHLRQVGYTHFFPAAQRIKQEVKERLASTHPEATFMFTWNEFSKVAVAAMPSILADNPSSKVVVRRLLSDKSPSPIVLRTKLKLQKKCQPSKIAEAITEYKRNLEDSVLQTSDRLVGTAVENIQTEILLKWQDPLYYITTPRHGSSQVDLLLRNKNDDKIVLTCELKASMISRISFNQRRVTICGIFKRNQPVIVDLFQSYGDVIRFYACLILREPQTLKQTLKLESDHLNLPFRVEYAPDEPLFFSTVVFSDSFLTALDEQKEHELRFLGDAMHSTAETLCDPTWKLDLLKRQTGNSRRVGTCWACWRRRSYRKHWTGRSSWKPWSFSVKPARPA